MRRRLIIKSYKLRANSNDNISKIIVVGFNKSKVNSGRYIEKVGVCTKYRDEFYYFLNLSRIGFWLNRGVCLKSKVSWIIGILGKGYLKNVTKKY